MSVIQRSIIIDAPMEQVFEVLEDPNHVPQYAPGVSRVDDVQRSEERVGDSYRTVCSVMGLDFPTKFTTLEYERPRKFIAQMDGAMTGDFTWTLAPQDGSTQMNLRIDYEMKGGILGKAMDTLLVERMNQKNAERMLENLKMLSEASQPPS